MVSALLSCFGISGHFSPLQTRSCQNNIGSSRTWTLPSPAAASGHPTWSNISHTCNTCMFMLCESCSKIPPEPVQNLTLNREIQTLNAEPKPENDPALSLPTDTKLALALPTHLKHRRQHLHQTRHMAKVSRYVNSTAGRSWELPSDRPSILRI